MSRPVPPELQEVPIVPSLRGQPCSREGCAWPVGSPAYWSPEAEQLFFHTRSCAMVQLRRR